MVSPPPSYGVRSDSLKSGRSDTASSETACVVVPVGAAEGRLSGPARSRRLKRGYKISASRLLDGPTDRGPGGGARFVRARYRHEAERISGCHWRDADRQRTSLVRARHGAMSRRVACSEELHGRDLRGPRAGFVGACRNRARMGDAKETGCGGKREGGGERKAELGQHVSVSWFCRQVCGVVDVSAETPFSLHPQGGSTSQELEAMLDRLKRGLTPVEYEKVHRVRALQPSPARRACEAARAACTAAPRRT